MGARGADWVGISCAWYRRALDAGAPSMETPALQPYGERRAAVRDTFDNQWYLAAPAS
jgi:PhnB protein